MLVVAKNGTAASPVLVAPQALELAALNVGTYAGPVTSVVLANSARRWIREGEQYDSSTQKELKYLIANGFEDGVVEGFQGNQREGVYDGTAYMTAGGAARETRRLIAYGAKHDEQRGLERAAVRGLPGGVVIGDFDPGERSATANVYFRVGRCAFLVADLVHAASRRSEGSRPAINEARRIARRARRVCG